MPEVDPKTPAIAIEIQDAFDPPTTLRGPFTREATHFAGMAGQSTVMRDLFDNLRRAARSDATVLIEGETGTGKEASGEAIHNQSRHCRGPFVVIDCASIPAHLLETELFGCERGAYTGAVTARAGAFEVANGGTIFLDEVGELSPELQPRILRVIERKQIKRVGSAIYQTVNVRVVAATNRSLRAEVSAGAFRADLYYRLAVVQIRMPPLRERLADLPLIIETLLERLNAGDCPEAEALRSSEFQTKLASYHWPGNVRQLRNYVERFIAMGGSAFPTLAESMLPAPMSPVPEAPTSAVASATPASSPLSEVRGVPLATVPGADPVTIDVTRPLRQARSDCLAAFERRYLEAILAAHGNVVTHAARAARIDRAHFYRMLWKYGIKVP